VLFLALKNNIIMKKNLLLLLFCSFFTILNAQFTGEFTFVLEVKIDGNTTTFKEGNCGFSATEDWGGPLNFNVCMPIVWGFDASDSLGCEDLLEDYSGKLVLLRRGGCEYGQKAYNAQLKNAAAVAIANGYGSTHGNDCTVFKMGKGTLLQNVTIPTFMFCRDMVDFIDAALKNGKQPEICAKRVSLHDPTAEYSYAVPVAQVDTMDFITVQCINQTGIGKELHAFATITDPIGTVTVLSKTKYIAAGADSIIYFPIYKPNPVVGLYTVEYTVAEFVAVGDTVRREFRVTPYTFATDNFKPKVGVPDFEPWFSTQNKFASLYKTGDNGMEAKWASFGIYFPIAYASEDSNANYVAVVLLDADEDNNGIATGILNQGSFTLLPFVAFSDFKFSKSLPSDSIVHVQLQSIVGNEILLKPNHLYYLMLSYDVNSVTQIPFSTSEKVEYGILNEKVGLITPTALFKFTPNGRPDVTGIARLNDKAFDPSSQVAVKMLPLSPKKCIVFPNPAVDFVQVDMSLDKENAAVTVSLIDLKGRIVASKTMKNIQNSSIKMDTQHLPSGNYGILVRTSGEGTLMKNLMICH
jgi:hypothetical protein